MSFSQSYFMLKIAHFKVMPKESSIYIISSFCIINTQIVDNKSLIDSTPWIIMTLIITASRDDRVKSLER